MLRRTPATIAAIIAVAVSLLLPSIATAQDNRLYGERILSKDGQWMAPVATRMLGSTDDHHVHRGSINSWDWSVSAGTPVFAARAGTVEAAGCYLYENRKWPIMQGYGCAISINHGGGVVSQYGHCAEGSILVAVGDQVDQWTQLCVVGKTGVTSYYHTHFTILVNGRPIRIDGVFDINQMKICHLCDGVNDPNAPVAKSPMPQVQPSTVATVADATGSVLLWQVAILRIKTMPAVTLGSIVLLFLLLLFLMTDRWRNLTVAGLVCAVGFVVVFEVPTANLRASGYQADDIAKAQAIQISLPAQFANSKDAQDIARLWSRHRDLIAQLAKETQIPVSAIVGTLMTESRGVGIVNGRMKIRLETHQFYKFLGNDALFNKNFRIPPSGKARFLEASYWNGSTWANVHGGQDDEYAAFQIAASLNEEAAYRALSMGAPQIFGDNYRMFGYGSAKEMYLDMSRGEHIQIINMFKYIAKVNHLRSLRAGNYEAFVANYNGPGNVATYTSLVRKYEALFKQMISATVLQ